MAGACGPGSDGRPDDPGAPGVVGEPPAPAPATGAPADGPGNAGAPATRGLRARNVSARVAAIEAPDRPDGADGPELVVLRRALRDPSFEVRMAAVRGLVRRGGEATGTLVRAVALGGEVAAQATAGLAAGGADGPTGDDGAAPPETATALWLRLIRGIDGSLHDPTCAAVFLRRGAGGWVDEVRAAVARGLEAGRIDPRLAPSCAVLAAPVSSVEVLRRVLEGASALRGSLIQAVGQDDARLGVLSNGKSVWADPAAAWALATAPSASFPPVPDDLPPAAALRAALEGFLIRPADVPDGLLRRGLEHRDRGVRCAAARVRDRRRGWPGDVERCGLRDPAVVALWGAEAVRAGMGADEVRGAWRRRTEATLPEVEWAAAAWARLWGDGDEPSPRGALPSPGSRWTVSVGEGAFDIRWTAQEPMRVPLVPGASIDRGGPHYLVVGEPRWPPPSSERWGGYHRRIRAGDVFALPGEDPGSGVLVLALGPVPPAVLAGAHRVGVVPEKHVEVLRALPPGTWVRGVSRETHADDGAAHQSKSSRNEAP